MERERQEREEISREFRRKVKPYLSDQEARELEKVIRRLARKTALRLLEEMSAEGEKKKN